MDNKLLRLFIFLRHALQNAKKINNFHIKIIKQGIKYMSVNLIPKNVSRDDLGKLFCRGEGIEIGAGCLPTAVAKDSIVHYADKRTPDELKSYFLAENAVNAQSISCFEGKKYDFVMAHHVLEHSANVIQSLIHWMSFIRDGGVLFVSIPNRHITPDASRLLTPPTHFLLDYIYQATEDDFESREHICGFLWGWIDVGGLKDKSKHEAAALVSDALNSDVNDLHWHTFNIDTMKFVIKMAAILSDRSIVVMFEQDGFQVQDEHRLVCKLIKSASPRSENINQLLDLKNKLRSTIYEVALGGLNGCATYSLSKEHKGKLFLVDQDKVRWVRSPQTLVEMGLNGRDYTLLELGEMEKGILGLDIGDVVSDRRSTIYARLFGREKLLGVELSPGAVPILEKSLFNVIYLDKFDHGAGDTYLQGKPVAIDTLLGDKLIDEVLEHDKYEYLFSSHVIEHIPDFIQFFKSAANILKNGARLIMYVPDKRYTFDVLRDATINSDIEVAHEQRLRRPSRAMARDVYSNSDFSAQAEGLWNKTYKAVRTYGTNEALRIADELVLSSADLHCFTFTPASFRGLIDYVIENHVPELQVLEITNTPYGHNEFVVDLVLRK